jgi:uncharacterized protein
MPDRRALLVGIRRWGLETLVFRVATGVALLHALDDAFFNRQPGVDLGQHAIAAGVALVVGVAAIVAFPRLRPGLRAACAIVFGVLSVVNGAFHVAHIAVVETANSDVTGVLALVAGVLLVGLGLAIPFLHRGEGERTRRRRWAYRLVAIGVGALAAFFVLFPIGIGIAQTHKHREAIGDPPSSTYEDVTFEASDGLRLSGWYVPSRNRAAVIVVHGGGGDRTGAVRHAELLARRGYGVLLYDSRGRGESEGSPNAFGWGWPEDVTGALAFLEARGDVDPDRIGGVGLSTGANVLIEVAAGNDQLKAVVADGATARSFGDYRNTIGLDEQAPFYVSMFTTVRVLSGSSPGRPLEDLVSEIAPTPLLLIACGRGVQDEREFNRVYAEAAREPVELWDLPDVSHTAAVRERPEEYERRVVGLFDEELLR